ncbi:transcription factor bHLH121 isoform X2 [Cornus florida]|uniref:transcription factor bHLH121 isoform X2 n=1 Tax=Cornus florida TaxID=4283 RepID=UPI0028A20698|nr:transcription factor bHLH121 isoform X2 [Cornus florida]
MSLVLYPRGSWKAQAYFYCTLSLSLSLSLEFEHWLCIFSQNLHCQAMDQWKTDDFSRTLNPNSIPTNNTINRFPNSHHLEPRQRPEVEVKDSTAARRVQKADREKLRRDKLNEHFLELGKALDPDRPKNDKATILTDTVQLLKDLTAEVNRLKTECKALSEESRELTQEKNELREEKTALKSDINNLNVQYQQRHRVMFPWGGIDPSVVMAPSYSYPVPLSVPPGPVPMHPSLQPFPFFGNQNPGAIPNPCTTFIPYPTSANPHTEQPSRQYAPTSHVTSKQDSKIKSLGCSRDSNDEISDDINNVATQLELKTPGSRAQQVFAGLVTRRKEGQATT